MTNINISNKDKGNAIWVKYVYQYVTKKRKVQSNELKIDDEEERKKIK